MSYYVPVDTPGGTIIVEVDKEPAGLRLTGGQFNQMSFTKAAEALKKNAEHLFSVLRDLAPSEIEVSFGIKAGVESGSAFFALAKANAEGSYTITLRWKEQLADESADKLSLSETKVTEETRGTRQSK